MNAPIVNIPAINIPSGAPSNELMLAALQFLNHGEACRARLAQAVAALPEPDAAAAGPTVLHLRQVAAIAVSRENFRGLSRVALDNALRAHCRHTRATAPGWAA